MATKAPISAETKDKAETKPYRVGNCPISHNGETYAPGDQIELTLAQAGRLGALIEPVKE